MENYHYIGETIEYKHLTEENPDTLAYHLHTHPHGELMVFLSGRGSCHAEGTEYNLEPGDIFIARPMESHYIEMKRPVPYERITFYFPMDIFNSADPEGVLMRPFYERHAGIRNLYKYNILSNDYVKIYRELIEREGGEIFIKPLLYTFLTDISRIFESGLNDIEPEETVEMRLIRYINHHLQEKMTVEMFSHQYYISPSQLERRIKNVTGLTVAEYINEKRMLTAKTMMEGGQRPTKIYRKVGFTDYSSFYRAYRKRFGTSPVKT